MIEPLPEKYSHSLAFIVYLVITAAICGAVVMVIEVLGSRVIGPFFGVSLFVWTSLISIALISLAAGYAVGGYISDKKGNPDYLYGIILIGGLAVLIIPLIKGFILKLCLPLDLRLGSLVSSFILFGPSLFLLGCVSPYIIKIAAQEMKTIGKTVGVFYAISTIGSVLGTMLTGFILIDYFGVNKIFQITGFVLIALSVFYFLVFRQKWFFLAILIIPFFLHQPETLKSVIMPDGTKAVEIFHKDSFYGKLKVVDYSYGDMHTRELNIDGLVQSGIDMSNRLSIYEYSYLLKFLPYNLNPKGKTCLVVGLGAGIIPMWYEKMGMDVDVVEIDPYVPKIAGDYFGFKISGEIIISDARHYISSSKKRYDYIIVDVFNGDITPGHLITHEVFQLLKLRMTENGILAVNLIGSIRDKVFMTASVIKTIKSVFQTVEVYPTFSTEGGDGTGNLVITAYNSAPMPFDYEKVKDFPVHPFVSESIKGHIGKKFYFPPDTQAIILSDDYNPIDLHDVWIREKVRKEILKTTDLDILI